MKRILYIDNENDFFGRELAQGFIAEATHNEWWDHWHHPFNEDDVESIQKLLPAVHGVVVRGKAEAFLKILKERDIPHLHIRGREHEATSDMPHADDAFVGNLAKEEVARLELKHRVFIGYAGSEWSDARGESFLSGQESPHESKLILKPEELQSTGYLMKVINWLAPLPKPLGILAANDHLAVAILIACQIAKYEVPDQVAIIGVDNNRHRCCSITPHISSINLHPEAIGKAFAQLMAQKLGLISEEQGEAALIPEPSLVVRESTHHLSPHLIHYRNSMEWIRKHALTGPTVQDLADHFKISRRALERAFNQCQAPAPASVLRKERMRQIKELLLRESVTQKHIAQQANFPDIPSLSNFVKRQTGLTPGQIRKGMEAPDDAPSVS